MLRTPTYSIRIKREVKLFMTLPGCVKIYLQAGLPEGDLVSRVVSVVRYNEEINYRSCQTNLIGRSDDGYEVYRDVWSRPGAPCRG